jgi:hypothetical protein
MTPSLNTEDFFSRGAPSDATNIGQFLATNREPILGEAAPPWVFVNPMSLGLLEGSVTDAETWQDGRFEERGCDMGHGDTLPIA